MFKADINSGAETLIGPSVHVKGDFKSQGNVQIEGQVTGTIQTSGNLRIGEQAKINANINAANAFVAGVIKGNVLVTERLELSAKAKIDGDINTKILVIAEGAQLNGRCQMSGISIAEATTKNKKDKALPTAEV
ncbi:MAG TPA: cell shape determination protein CcmA [Candidatus Veblenbacteria bacterium]|uniref:Cell shape determination protein CcmA n=4 Tax=Candidatus Vebleniibacteriota TaxID=1817921 RepID=A0A1G2Q4C6_9BACT|nr:MAG: hypothetical protein UV69_C0046G0008 [Parcubacteria group bacterium GW2011_GWE2_43_12]KKT11947.1 MAG: hypothetical protein UV92_C0038G0009 [Parcubacteria group bacterium GW2011_GWA1_43_27]OHA54738.1 MAG: hypothetical protein A2388_00630 [Candidatus Veblenbacteria bacterium RIFOXYB1_FULL_43_13]OHA54965.1 MAG: hypothetical protein A2226_00010 [Candidatus Veblenbacteria bacterium RIFOXYA2_FULL_43_9]OHA55418.1 MAG: hypothetical protein A2429_02475 [Candidatus Veblenbacteria bacterium RIFOXY